MNMLQIQDALKGASDAHLMQEMQNPSGSAPQFLVLSEMKRRKDMRSQQQSAPQGTVADELTQAAQPREVLPLNEREPEYEDEEEEMAAGGLVGLRRYAEGGIVRMQDGGRARGTPPSRTLAEMTPAEIRAYTSGQLPGYTREEARGELYRRGIDPASLLEFDPNTQRRNPNFYEMDPGIILPPSGGGSFGGEEQPRPSELPPIAQTETPPATQEGATPAPGSTQGGQQYGPPAPTRTPRPAGLPGIRASQAPTEQSAQSGVTSPSSQTPDRLAPILDRIREGRTDPSERRSEAMNMALIDAGLRIAGSKSPRLAGAISEGGVPALQAFSQQSQQIRQDQRQDLRDELQTAMAQNTNDFQRGRLSQQEFATRQQLIIAQLREAGENSRSGASNSIAQQRLDLERGNRISREEYLNAPPERRDLMDRYLGRGRDPQSSTTARYANDLSDGISRIDAIEQREVAAAQNNGATPTQIQVIQRRYDQRRQELEQRYRLISPGLFPQLPTANAPRSGSTVVAPIGS
jgi:hypothetical protein